MSLTSDLANLASSLKTTGTLVSLNVEKLNGQTGSFYTNLANSNITLANTQLKSYVDGQISFIQSINDSQNTRLNTTDSTITYIHGVNDSQNTRLNTVDSTLTYMRGVDDSQNNTISNIQTWLNSNVSYFSAVNTSQNNSINSTQSDVLYLVGALNQTNSNIVLANTQLKSYVDGQITYLNDVNYSQNNNIISSNTQLKSYVDGEVNSFIQYQSGVNVSQNNRLDTVQSNTIYLFGALNQTNTDIVLANTQLKSYVEDLVLQANNWLQSNDTHTLSVSQSYTDNSNTQLKAYVDGNFYQKTGGNISGAVTISSNLLVTGNLTVSGNVTSVSANNMILKDNMIYLNEDTEGSANPDLGITGAYNDGTYHHAGFFRDASDSVWKVFDSYRPEPDASPWIDTSNSTFRIASFQANTLILSANPGTAPLDIQSSTLVNNLNADLLDGQQGSYYSPVSFAQQSFDVANLSLSYVQANSAYLIGALNQANNDILQAKLLAQNAYDAANTDYTNINISSGTYGNSSFVPVLTLSSNGRISQVSTVAISGLDANTITSGIISVSRLAQGTANANTYLSGDGTWKVYTPPTSSGTGGPINISETNITSSVTINSRQNGFSVGPISIAPTASITVSPGQKWIIINGN